MKKYFEEKQGFNQVWLKILMIGVTIAALVPVYYETIIHFTKGEPMGNPPMSETGIIIFDVAITLVIIAATSVIFLLKLKTVIDSEGIHIYFKPLIRHKLIKPDEIEKWEVRKYSPIKEYGGWGYRFGTKKGVAYNTMGNIGLQLRLKKGKDILIGTQRPDAIKKAMEKLMNKQENG